MSDPRLYLYRKSGRAVWDAELRLPDGQRRTWRTGLEDHDAAERAAWARFSDAADAGKFTLARQKITAPEIPAATPVVVAQNPNQTNGLEFSDGGNIPPAPISAEIDLTETLASDETRRSDGLLDRFDAWFFGDLRRLFPG